jgi:malate dehydrogenase
VLALKTESRVADISRVVVWGNNSNTIYPDLRNAMIGDKSVVRDLVTKEWIEQEFIPAV